VKPDKDVLVAEIGLNEIPLTALAGGVPMDLVAGARFGNYLLPYLVGSVRNVSR